jgi:hypothetical protein
VIWPCGLSDLRLTRFISSVSAGFIDLLGGGHSGRL